MNCGEFSAFANAAVDDELRSEQLAIFNKHIEDCLSCKKEWANLLQLRSQIRAIVAANPPAPSMQVRINQELRKMERKGDHISVRFLIAVAAALTLLIGTAAYILHIGAEKNVSVAAIDLSTIISQYRDHVSPGKAPQKSGVKRGKSLDVNYSALSREAGFSVTRQNLAGYSAFAAKVVHIGADGKSVVYRCYRTVDPNCLTCIDCYQARKQDMSISGMSFEQMNGKLIASGVFDGKAVVCVKGELADSVFISTLPRKKLLSLVAAES